MMTTAGGRVPKMVLKECLTFLEMTRPYRCTHRQWPPRIKREREKNEKKKRGDILIDNTLTFRF